MAASNLATVGSGWYGPVTVVTGSRRVDLALPRTVPVGELLPQVLALCRAPAGSAEPVRWALIRLDGSELGADRCLDDAQVRDGEVLALHARPTTVRPAYVEDVRDVVEDAVDAAGRHWSSRTTMRFTLLAGAAALTLAALVPGAVSGPVSPAALAAAIVAVAGGVAAAGWATRRNYRDAAYALAATACLWGGVTGTRLAGWWELPAAPALGIAAGGGLAAAAAARLVTRHAAGHLAAAGVLAAVAVAVTIPPAAGTATLTGVRVAAPLLILVIGIVPRLALTAGGLGLADYRVRHGGQLSPATVAERLRRSEVLLTGTLVGVAVAAAGLGLALVAAPGIWDRWLGALTGLALLLRSRVFSGVAHVTPLRLAGALVLAVQAGRLADQSPALSVWLPALVTATLLALLAVSAVALSEISRARVKQLLDAAEVIVVAATVPVAAGALGWYRFAAGIIG